jgi:2-amino-4-hydroxy-6-hydroxymethyldihydropteridine diphosphokinase
MSLPCADVAYVALGSNVGHRGEALERLRSALAVDGVTVEAASREVLTRPVGVAAQGDFHNQVVRLRSRAPWPPERWLAQCKKAELAAGRRETYRWGPRRADADILLLGERGDIRVDTDELTVPHAELDNRPFLHRLLDEVRTPPGAG